MSASSVEHLVKHAKVIIILASRAEMMLPSDAIDHDARRQQVDVSTSSESAFRPGGVLLFGYLKKLKVCYTFMNSLLLRCLHLALLNAILFSYSV